jgi:hypothetical protein
MSKRMFVLLPLMVALTSHGSLAAARRVPAELASQPARPAQPQATAPEPAPAPVPPQAASPFDARETREQLNSLLRQYPPSLADVLRIDPSMLSNQAYLTTYPALAEFLAQHPEVGHNPSFFVGSERSRGWDEDTPRAEAVRTMRGMIEGLQIMLMTGLILGVLAWLLKMLVDYRRWLRVTRVQAEVHTKLLDRFSSNEDLLAYIQTPSGRRFLESAPIPLDAEPRAVNAPLNRILWSVQAGVVLALGGLGLQYVSTRQIEEIGQPLFAMGVLGLALGLGFLLSAVISYVLSQRLGLLPVARPRPVDNEGASL